MIGPINRALLGRPAIASYIDETSRGRCNRTVRLGLAWMRPESSLFLNQPVLQRLPQLGGRSVVDVPSALLQIKMQVMARDAVVFSRVPLGLVPEVLDPVHVYRAGCEAILRGEPAQCAQGGQRCVRHVFAVEREAIEWDCISGVLNCEGEGRIKAPGLKLFPRPLWPKAGTPGRPLRAFKLVALLGIPVILA
jgi:hypothetical protein